MSKIPMVNEKYFRRQALYWLIAAAIMAGLWLIVWLTSSVPAMINKQNANQTSSYVVTLPTAITALNELDHVVKPMDNSALVRDLRNYPPEFKDKVYFDGISGRYTIELMDVTENEVIVDYLNSREDRNNFAYFRYTDANDNKRYVLTYGKFTSPADAESALQTVNFRLPKSVTKKTTKISELVAVMDNYELGQDVVDLASSQPRRVRLQATHTEIPAKAATPADEELARLSRERALQTQISQQTELVRQPTDLDIQNDINRLSNQKSQVSSSDLPMAPTARPQSSQQTADIVPKNETSKAAAPTQSHSAETESQ